MKRFLAAVLLSLCTAGAGSAQDIPLSKILIEGEPWRVAARDLPGVTFLEGSANSVLVYQGKPSARVRLDGKVEQLSPSGNDRRTNTMVSSGSHTFQLDGDS